MLYPKVNFPHRKRRNFCFCLYFVIYSIIRYI